MLHLLHGALALSRAAPWRRFAAAAADPAAAQRRILARLLRDNEGAAYGAAHRFAAIDSPAAFAARVPLSTYATLRPWIDRAAAGEPAVLTRAPVLAFEPTSGSTAAHKLIPYTAPLLCEVRAAANAWLADLYRGAPSLRGTVSYWSISPATRPAERTPGGVPVGLDDDTAYFGRWSRWALRRLLAVPPEVARLADLEAWRRATAVALLAAERLGLISVWSPTFLLVLLDYVERHLADLVAALAPARRAAVERACRDRFAPEQLWPRLRVVSTWADGASATFIPALRRALPTVRLQPKGLLATEGVVSIPIGDGDGAVLAVGSHYLEFIDLQHPAAPPLGAAELRPGADYAPVLTTGGGLWRYQLRDVVRCVGHWRATPRVRFTGRLELQSDLCGEKLGAPLVEAALARAVATLAAPPRFAALAPRQTPPGYLLLVEADGGAAAAAQLAEAVEAELGSVYHYAYCRKLGQLAPIEPVRCAEALRRYQRAHEARGLRAGDVKPAGLLLDPALVAALTEP